MNEGQGYLIEMYSCGAKTYWWASMVDQIVTALTQTRKAIYQA